MEVKLVYVLLEFILHPNLGIFVQINLISNKIEKKIKIKKNEDLVSYYSGKLISNILSKNSCELPLIDETTNVHKIIYNINAKYFKNKKNLPT